MRVLVYLALTAIVSTVGVRMLYPSRTAVLSSVPSPRLDVPAAALDFGTVWETESHEHSLRLTNSGSAPAEVAGWSTSCGCVGVSPDRLTLLPGETKPVVVTLNLLAARRGDDAVRPIEQVIAARLSGNAEQKWVVTGKAKSFLRPLPDAAPSPQSELAPSSEPFLIPLDFRIPVRTVAASCDNPLVTARVMARQGSDGHVVEVKLKDGLPVGRYPFTLAITATTAWKEPLPAFEHRATFRVTPDLQVSPPFCPPCEPISRATNSFAYTL